MDVDGEILRRNRRFLKPSIHQPMGHEETLEENSKDCESEKGKSDRNYTESTVKVGMVPQQIEEKTGGKCLSRDA